jgi:hypothetical protein
MEQCGRTLFRDILLKRLRKTAKLLLQVCVYNFPHEFVDHCRCINLLNLQAQCCILKCM